MAKYIKITPEIIKTKQALDETIKNINTDYQGAINAVLNCAQNLHSESINGDLYTKTQAFFNKNENLLLDLITKMQTISTFMAEQINEYGASIEEAQQSLQTLIQLIQTVLPNSNFQSGASSNIGVNENVSTITGTNAAIGGTISSSVASENIQTDFSTVAPSQPGSNQMSGTFDEAAYNQGASDVQAWLLDKKFITMDAFYERLGVVNASYNYYKQLGYSDEFIAAMLGNMCQESSFNLYDDPNYPTGIGVYQWTESRAPEALDLNSQLEHSVYEINNRINGGKTVWERVENTNYSVDEYTRIFALFFEGAQASDGSVIGLSARQGFARAIYYLIKNGTIA